MRSLLALFALALLGVSVAACGGASKTSDPASRVSSTAPASGATPATTTTSSTATSSQGYLNDGDNDIIGDADNDNKHDNDNDNTEDHKLEDNGDYHDSDDHGIMTFGHPANAADRLAITSVVRRYYAVAAAGDGEKACSMLVPTLAKATTEDYGHGSAGPSYLSSGETCPAVLALLFKHFHAQLTTAINITRVRVSGDRAVALLGSRATPASYISIQRQDGVWKIGTLLGAALP